MDEARINKNNLPVTPQDKYLITDKMDKIKIMGAYFESINSPRPLNKGTRLEEIITEKIKPFIKTYEENKTNKVTLIKFSTENQAQYPTNNDIKDYFCNTIEVENILRKLPNKTSTGIDNIPAIVLKHLPRCIIRDLTIIFNNALNNCYFPVEWKRAKVLPIPKPNKNHEEINSYRPNQFINTVRKTILYLITNLDLKTNILLVMQ